MFNLKKIVGVLLSHEHGDHSKYTQLFLYSRIPVYMSAGTKSSLTFTGSVLPLLIESGVKKYLGNFTVLPFDVKHDAAEPLGFLIHHQECGNVLFATDTYFLPYTFAGLNNILIEANYRKDLLEANIQAGSIPPALRDRTLQSHMSLDTCREALLANDLSRVNNIILIHLSDGNSDAREFVSNIHRATGKTVYAAEKGMKIQFNKAPF